MEESVIIYIQSDLLDELSDENAHIVKWIKLDGDGVPITQGAEANLKQVSSITQNAHVTVLMPLQAMLLTSVNTRARKKKHLQKAIPYALEDEVADDVENLHFALGRRYNEDNYPVAVIEKNSLDLVLEKLSSADIFPDVLTADVFGLPYKEDTWTILIEDERALIRNGLYKGFTIDLHNLQQILTSSLRQAELTPVELNIYRCNHEQSNIKKYNFPINTNKLDDCPPGLFADGYIESNSINLLQGNYKKKDKKHRQFAPWKFAAVLFSLWISLVIITVLIDNTRLSKQEDNLNTQIVQLMKQTFPDMHNVTADSARIKMESRLKNYIVNTNNRSKAGFMEILAVSGESIQQTGKIDVTTMNYSDGNLNLKIKSTDIQLLDQVKQSLSSKNYFAEIKSANTNNSVVEAMLVISEGEPK